jgi:hypothetical protein
MYVDLLWITVGTRGETSVNAIGVPVERYA